MDRASYVTASNGMAQMLKLEMVSNNLANVNTPGYKRQTLIGEEQTFEETLASVVAGNDPFARADHDRAPAVQTIESGIDFSQGPIQETDNALDVALKNPKDFFVVQTANGLRYTRAGNFTLNEAGQIVTPDGQPVQGDGGALVVSGSKVTITSDGSVNVDGTSIGRLQVVRFESMQGLKQEGSSRFILRPAAPTPVAVEPDVLPRSLEASNVSAISSMLDLISASKSFELYTRSVQSIDQMDQRSINDIGRR